MPVNTDRLLPVYRSIKGLKSQLVRKILAELKPLMTMLPETLPPQIIRDENLPSRSDAVLGMHFPKQPEDVALARERLAFEELFQLLLASQLNRQDNAKLEGWHIPFDQSVVADFVKQLPFELTGAQRRAAWEIIQDFEKKTPMNRLLQGDVGSGKTVVAGLAARQAAASGYQTALMAPTEILASQHAETLSRLLQPFGVTVGLLTGSVKGAARKTLYEQIAGGSVDVVVGTHALIQETVHFHKLGFVVIDEQHRFGVKQRQQLLTKSEHMPHLLAMTATPIPRSLALTVYGELDVSILNELPKGRKPIETKLWSPNSQAQLYAKVDAEIKAGRQGYVICSLIDDNPDNEIKSVQAEHVKLQNSIFKHRRIGLLHGKMKPDEKDEVMTRFAKGDVDILVSTTVVEVGVDVPNATVMIIENADRFGLSQLHQLRGRVGRSSHQSYCFLVMSDSSKPTQRLKEIEKSNDGFYLAEVDLKLRGPGEIYGRSQHGALNLQIATLSDTKLIARAQKQAKSFAASGASLLQYKELAAQVHQYQRLTTLN
jgi:ATP-dependent DNA helicase RecG